MKRLSRNDIEMIADKYVQVYMKLPEVQKSQMYRIEPELLLEKVLGLSVEYRHLSRDGSILGLTSFGELGIEVFEDSDDEDFLETLTDKLFDKLSRLDNDKYIAVLWKKYGEGKNNSVIADELSYSVRYIRLLHRDALHTFIFTEN